MSKINLELELDAFFLLVPESNKEIFKGVPATKKGRDKQKCGIITQTKRDGITYKIVKKKSGYYGQLIYD